MEKENAAVMDNTIVYGITEEPVVKYLENHLKCMEEEYKIDIFLQDREGTAGSLEKRLCINYDQVDQKYRRAVEEIMESLIPALFTYGQQQYIEQQLVKKKTRKDDPLTGVFNREYLMNRAAVITRAEIYPTAVIAVKVKGWKSIVDSYGRESGDSLVQLIASILGKAAEKDYLIGRIREDIFVILIPLVREGETEKYCWHIRAACQAYEDSVFAPRLEIGITETERKGEDVRARVRDAVEQVEDK